MTHTVERGVLMEEIEDNLTSISIHYTEQKNTVSKNVTKNEIFLLDKTSNTFSNQSSNIFMLWKNRLFVAYVLFSI